MPKLLILLAAATAASAASAQGTLSPNLYPQLSSDSSGWTWHLRKDTLRTATTRGDQLYHFWMVGQNRGSSRARKALASVKLSCASRQFVQLRLVSRDGAGAVVSESGNGDHKSNWTAIKPGTPTDGAHKLLCQSPQSEQSPPPGRRR